MKEQFDKQLAEKIKASFQHHEESPDPKEWEKLSRAYYKNKNVGRLTVWSLWLSGVAASFLLIFFLIPGAQESPVENISMTIPSSDNKSAEIEVSPPQKNSKGDIKSLTEKDKPSTDLDIKDATKPNLASPSSFSLPNSNISESTQIAELKIKNGLPVALDENIVLDAMIKPEISFNPLVSEVRDIDTEKAQKSIEDWLNSTKPEMEKKEATASKKSFRLGVLVSPQSISNATQSLNLGAGVVSEFSFSKRLKLDVGVAYAKQNLTPSTGGEGSSFDAMDSPLRSANFSNNYISSSYELSFGQLEIPINLKYRILEKDASNFYLITGVSNMVYLNQQNVGTFSSVNLQSAGFASAQPMVQTFTDVSRPMDDSNGVNMGRMLNFSLGYEYNLNNGTFLSLEPFYKMSIGNQTFIDQQFSIGGINLRMNFQIKK